jgi:acetyl esterase/lipase
MTDSAAEAVIARIRAVYRGWDRATTLETMRRDWEALHAPPPSAPPAIPVSANGVEAAWIGADGLRCDRAVLYFHGGGFQMGSIETHRALAAGIAAGAGCRVLSVNYRLAPEHRFPAPVEDGLAAYEWLRASGLEPRHIAVAGDSAGGGLAVSLMLALKARGFALPAAAALMSPWTDMEASGASFETRAASDPFHQRATIKALAKTYLGGADPRNPLASPVHGDLSGLPPMLIQVGDRETVLDDARLLAERARSAGVDARLEVWPRMFHVFQLYADAIAEGREAIAAIGAHLKGGLRLP